MSATPAQKAEVQFVRERFKDLLKDRDFRLILEGETAHDGWRAEFIGKVEEEGVVVLVHKPSLAPFVTVCVTVTIDGFDASQDCVDLMDQSSDFDVSAYLSEKQSNIVHLASRLLLSGINAADFDFTLNNLLFCRESILSHFSEGNGA